MSWPTNWRWSYLIAPIAMTYAYNSACYVVAVKRIGPVVSTTSMFHQRVVVVGIDLEYL